MYLCMYVHFHAKYVDALDLRVHECMYACE
jgi:hypothetical protein